MPCGARIDILGVVKLNQSYENIVFNHHAGDRRVFQLLSVAEERRSYCDNVHGRDDHPCKVDHG